MKRQTQPKKRAGCRTWLLIAFGLIVFGAVVSPKPQTAIFPVDTPESPKRAPTVNIVIDVATATATNTPLPTFDTAATSSAQRIGIQQTSDASDAATIAALRKTATAISRQNTATSSPKATVAATRVVATRVPATAAPTKVPPTQAPAAPPTVAPPPVEPPTVAPPADPGQPVFIGKSVSPAWWPCVQGQIKGNRNSMIYHVPTARDYAKTYANVQCFNTEAEAQGAGYRRAQR